MADSEAPDPQVGQDQADDLPPGDVANEFAQRVAARRRRGEYPAELEARLDAHRHQITADRSATARLRQTLDRLAHAEPLSANRIPTDSRSAAGAGYHRVMARALARQSQGMLDQMQAAFDDLRRAVEVIGSLVDGPTALELASRIDTVIAEMVTLERDLGAERWAAPEPGRPSWPQWCDDLRLAELALGAAPARRVRATRLAALLAGHTPTLVLEAGLGDLVAALADSGGMATGSESNEALATLATAAGRPVRHLEPLAALDEAGDGELGAICVIRGAERLDPDRLAALVGGAERKLRPGGWLVIEVIDPENFIAAAAVDPSLLRPVGPAYLAALCHQAGFPAVEMTAADLWTGTAVTTTSHRLVATRAQNG
ncbi:MAG: hypothetical protein M3R71_00290 [Actinomycetota bacterium]|nr:hypothetical protein [Actinomycetota bacterium]